MKCAFCGNELPEDSQFCQYCGRNLQGTRNQPPFFENGKLDRDVITNASSTYRKYNIVTEESKDKESRKIPFYISFFYIIPVVLICICLNVKLDYLNTEPFYFIIILLCALASLFLMIASYTNKKASVVFHILSIISCVASIVLVFIKPWSDAGQSSKYSYNSLSEQMPTLLLITAVFLATLAIIGIIVFVIQAKSFSTKNRMVVYEELERLYSLREKGIITDSEFNQIKSDLFQIITK